MPLVAALSVRLGSGSVRGVQGDLVARALQLADQAVAVGLADVALQEPIGPEIRVRLPGRQQMPGDHQDRVRDRHDRLLVPPPSLQPGVLAGKIGALAASGGVGRLNERDRSHREPLRVVPARCLPADSLLPGQIPAQLAKCPAEVNWPMSVPISARMTSAVRWLTPGMVINRAGSGEKGATTRATWLLSRSTASSR